MEEIEWEWKIEKEERELKHTPERITGKARTNEYGEPAGAQKNL